MPEPIHLESVIYTSIDAKIRTVTQKFSNLEGHRSRDNKNVLIPASMLQIEDSKSLALHTGEATWM